MNKVIYYSKVNIWIIEDRRWIGIGYRYDGCEIIQYKLNNNINGKGKEYYITGKLEFEGEYLIGRRNGKGKEYNERGQIIFKGEYLNDLKWNGYGYAPFNNIIYELKDGKGFVKEYDNHTNALIFEGEYLLGKRHGKGKEYDEFGKLIFEGNFLNGQRNGKGVEYKGKDFIKYIGEYINGKKSGQGKFRYSNKLSFEGEFLYDFVLKGKLFFKGKLEYEGEFYYNNKLTGKGYDKNGNIIYELVNGTGKTRDFDEEGRLTFKGEILNGVMNGKGKEYQYGQLIYEGEFLDGRKHGRGKEYDESDDSIYVGEFLNNRRHGRGKEYDFDLGYLILDGKYVEGNLLFEGEFINGVRHGRGKEYDKEGNLIYEGEYANGERNRIKK